MMHTTNSSNTTSAGPALAAPRRSSLVKVGGALGIAATCIALAIFTVAIFGFNAVFILSPLPLILGGIGLVVAIVGAVVHTHDGEEETQPIAAVFVCLMGLLAGAIELYFWMHMPPPGGGA